MNFIDDDNILDKPDRDPIQLEEGKSAVSDVLLIKNKAWKSSGINDFLNLKKKAMEHHLKLNF